MAGKINMAAVAQKVGGIAAGTVAGGMLFKYLKGVPSLEKYAGPIMIAAGVYAPQLINKGKPGIAQHAGDALIAKGVNTVIVANFGGFGGLVSGVDDDVVAGLEDDSVAGYPTSDETIVSGIYGEEDEVSGVSPYIH
jgi:hypothetical protein